jgi:hypothetical protein
MLREWALLIPLLLCLAVGSPTPVLAVSDFERLVRSLERDLDLEREHIPAKWLVNTALFFTRSGVKNLDFATFENLRASDERVARNFLRTVRQNVGPDWIPWVSTWSRMSGERTAIYARPAGKNWELLVATVEPGEATLVRIRVHKDRMLEYLADHGAVLSDTERKGD